MSKSGARFVRAAGPTVCRKLIGTGLDIRPPQLSTHSPGIDPKTPRRSGDCDGVAIVAPWGKKGYILVTAEMSLSLLAQSAGSQDPGAAACGT